MTTHQQAEAQARAWLELWYAPVELEVPYSMAQSLTQLLLSTQADVLEEVARAMKINAETCAASDEIPDAITHTNIANWLEQQAAQRRTP